MLSARVRALVALVLAAATTSAAAEERAVLRIEPGPRVQTAAERAITQDLSQGLQHGVILVDETLRDESRVLSLRIARHVRAKILSNEARGLADIQIPYEIKQWHLDRWWGRTILPDGQVIELARSDLQKQTLVQARGWSISARRAALPGVVPGCVIDYGWEVSGGEIDDWMSIPLQRPWPIVEFRYQWFPATWLPSQYFVQRVKGLSVDVTRQKSGVLIQGNHIPAVTDEPWMPPADLVRAVATLFYNIGRSSPDPNTFWNDVATGEEKRVADFISTRKPLKKAVGKIPLPDGAPLEEKLRAAYDWLEHNIVNESMMTAEEQAAAGEEEQHRDPYSRPARVSPDAPTAATVLSAGRASREQLRYLYVGLARALGAEANIVMAADRRDRVWQKSMLSKGQLDHRVVAVRGPGVPLDRATLVDPGSGLPYGAIAWWLTPTLALVATDTGAGEMTLEAPDPHQNVLESNATIRFTEQETGEARVQWSARGTGQRRYGTRLSLRLLDPRARRERLDELCGSSGDFEVASAAAPDLADLDAGYHLECEGRIVNLLVDDTQDRFELPVAGAWFPGAPWFPSATRELPVLFSYPHVDLTTVDVAPPPGFAAVEPPPVVRLDGPYGSYGLKVTRTPDGVPGRARLRSDRDHRAGRGVRPVALLAGRGAARGPAPARVRACRRLAMIREALRAALPAVLLLGSSLPGAGTMAAKLPDWAREVARDAPAAPEGIAPDPERILLSDTVCTIQQDGSLRIRRRLAVQELSSDPKSVGFGEFFLPGTSRVETNRCWHLPPRGRASREDAHPVDFTLSDEFLTDTKVRRIGIAGVVKGSIVFFEFEAVDVPYFVSLFHLFYEGAPVDVARYEVRAPDGWRLEPVRIRGRAPDPIAAEGSLMWELRELPAPERVPLAPDPAEEAPLVGVQPFPPPGAKTQSPIFADWSAMSAWYDALSRERREVTPTIEREADQLSAGAGDDPLATLLAAAHYVRDSVRYVDIELGIGGWQPHTASETLANLYGDCKDKATLLGALLAARGIASYPVLVNATTRDALAESYPVGRFFDHAVLAVPERDGLVFPREFAHALVQAGDLGRLLIIDATDDRTAVGSLSTHLAGKHALVVAGDRGRLVELPKPDASSQRIVRRITERPGETGEVIERISTYSGDFAAYARSSYGLSALDRRRGLERRMMDLWPRAAFEGIEVERETEGGDYVETLRLSCPSVACSAARDRIELFPGAADEVERVPLGRRTAPVQYDHPFTIRYDARYEGLPEVQAPRPRRLEGQGWSVATTHRVEDGMLESTWEVRLERTRFDRDDFAELRRFWAAVAGTASTAVPLGVP